jgi:GNAT superfamily N-acetyltransferase
MSTTSSRLPIHIRVAEIDDAPAIAALIGAIDEHYAKDGFRSDQRDTLAMVRHSMQTEEGTRYALAFREGQAIALACFALLRPGFRLGGLLFLKELFVVEEARGQAAGATLMAWLTDFARARGITRIDLTTDSANAGAQKFYEKLGGAKQDKVYYRFFLDGAAGKAVPQA